MRFASLRSRLSIVTLTTLVAGLGTLVTAGNVLFADTVASDNSQRLSARLEAEVAALSGSAGHVRIRSPLNDGSLDAYGWIYLGDRLIEAPSQSTAALNALAARLARSSQLGRQARSGDLLLGSRSVGAGAPGADSGATVIAGVDVGQLESLRHKVLWGSVALALLLVAGGWLTIRRVLVAALDPVAQMTRHAEAWETHDLDRRFDLGAPRDEITGLAATLDRLLNRIAASRRHEQRFAAEIAHELRTPLAAIRGAAELAAGDQDDAGQAALSDIVAHSSRMATTLDTLIAHARRETNPAADGVDLAAVLTSFPDVVLLPHQPLPAVEGDARIIRQLVAPLVENAERRAASRVTVELHAGHGEVHAVVRDDGPGVDPGLGTRVFLPGVCGRHESGDGAGLGLPLAQRLAHSCGGEIRLGDGPGGCFVITLPAVSGVVPAPTPQ